MWDCTGHFALWSGGFTDARTGACALVKSWRLGINSGFGGDRWFALALLGLSYRALHGFLLFQALQIDLFLDVLLSLDIGYGCFWRRLFGDEAAAIVDGGAGTYDGLFLHFLLPA